MRRFGLILAGLAFAGAVGARALDEPALGGGAGSFMSPAEVTVCPLGSVVC
jgi:hypothetical protein